MNQIKFVVRQIGIPNKGLDVLSPEEVSEYLAYQYPDYQLHTSHYLGVVKDKMNNEVGWKVMLILVPNDEVVISVESSEPYVGSGSGDVAPKPRRGRKPLGA